MVRIEPLDIGRGAMACSTVRCCEDWREPYDGFNVCFYTGDSEDHLDMCLMEFGERVVMPRQTHSLNVAVVETPCRPENVDALVTSVRGLTLAVNTADCVPVVMADTHAGVVAAVHSGWKGTVGRIAAKAVAEMVKLGAVPARIRAAMGPCICPDCFEVGAEVAQKFELAGFGDAVVPTLPRPHVDLPKAVKLTLEEAGLSEQHIQMPIDCSRCNPWKWWSARCLGINSGRTLTAVRLDDVIADELHV